MLLNSFQTIQVLNRHAYLLKTCNWSSTHRKIMLWMGKHCADWLSGPVCSVRPSVWFELLRIFGV